MRPILSRLPLSASRNNAVHDTLGRHRIRLLVSIGYVIAAVAYFSWRVTVLNPDAIVFSIMFLLGELFGTVICFVLAFTGWRRITIKAGPPESALAVDVFITVYNEPVDVIRRTALGAIAMDYAHETWILDDGNRSEIRSLAHELGCRYLGRTTNIGAKAGNLNNGLRHATGEFVAVFDADHVPQRDFLVKLLGYFRDPQVAMVQTPQDYFNMNGFQYGRDKYRKLIWHDQSVFHYVGQTGRNHWNAATFCGTSAVLRRSAVDEIGGIPEETVTEDMHASVKMQRRGYSTVYHPEPLAFGIAPTGLREYLRQRLRWGEGNMQVHRLEGLPFSSGLTVAQRLSYAALAWNYLSAWQKGIYVLAPIILLALQVAPIVSDFETFLILFLPYLVFTYLMFEEMGRGYGNLVLAEKFEVARLVAGLFATAGLFRSNIRFRVSSKETSGHVPVMLLTPQIAIVACSCAAVIYALWRQVAEPENALIPWLAAIISVIALINAYLAFRVIIDAVRSARRSEHTYRIVAPVPVRLLSGDAAGVLLKVTEISTREIIFESAPEFGLRIGDRIKTRLYLPDFDLTIDMLVDRIERRGEKSHVTAGLLWSATYDRDRLDLALHAGRWYRPFVGYHEARRTPYDVLRDFIDTGRLSPPPIPQWQPIVFKALDGTATREAIGFVLTTLGDTPAHPKLVLFGPVSIDHPIVVEASGPDAIGTMTYFRVGSELFGTVVDEAAFEVAGGRVFSAVQLSPAELEIVSEEPSARILQLPRH